MELDFFKDIRDTFLDHILFKAISLLPEKERHEFVAEKQTGKFGYDVEFIVNGHKLPIIEAFNLIRDQLDFMVKREATRLVEEKMDDVLEHAYDISNVMDDARKQLNQKVQEILG